METVTNCAATSRPFIKLINDNWWNMEFWDTSGK